MGLKKESKFIFFSAITYDDFQKSSIFNGSRVKHYETGYLPVKNRTKTNPQILCAFLTTGNEGYSIIEVGLVDSNVIILDMNKYLARSFGLGFSGGSYQVYEVVLLQKTCYLYNVQCISL